MGMFTTIVGESGSEYQIYGGDDDNCDTYKIGDVLPVSYSPYRAGCGTFLDGIYDARNVHGGPTSDRLAVISGGVLVAIVGPFPRDDDGAPIPPRHVLFRQYGCKYPPDEMWSDALWAVLGREFAADQRRQAYIAAEEYGLSPEDLLALRAQRLRKALGDFTRGRMQQEGIMRQLLPPTDVATPAELNEAFLNALDGQPVKVNDAEPTA